ncbi:MAG: hypothetical protein M1160_01620 [Candidatus Marsarchaeota archaeon]|nr:hypothetical protein [Candidatus Marsarchaeota archaeon]MCL5111562.1 hypothetical protein [Candidatus Marsarchaeota archaeon]
MPAVVYECSVSESQELKKFLEYDPYLDKSLDAEQLKKLNSDSDANIIFSRQEFMLRDGASLGLSKDKLYLYINASEDFLAGAEKKLKNKFKSIRRAPKEDEEKFIDVVEEEHSRGNAGIGAIFGG